ncbi:MAG: tetratricopeptide repeat protein [Oligoflexia bacterium]|nr:tetratricopeptide repeat protein [Oligoflexia bacterium]
MARKKVMLRPSVNNLLAVAAIIFISGCGKRTLLTDTYYRRAMKSWDRGDLRESINNFKKVVSVSPHSPKGQASLFHLAEVYYQAGKYRKALNLFELYLDTSDAKGKELLNVLDKIAVIYEKHLKDDQNALRFYKRALDLTFSKEDRIKFLVKTGKTYFSLYQFQQAVDYLEKAAGDMETLPQKIAMSEMAQEAYYYLGLSYAILARDVKDRFQGGESYIGVDRDTIDKCIEAMDKCIKFSVKTKYGVLCKFQKAEALVEIDEYDKAVDILEDLQSSYPNKTVIETRLDRIRGLAGR